MKSINIVIFFLKYPGSIVKSGLKIRRNTKTYASGWPNCSTYTIARDITRMLNPVV